jgi:hypothetical protein
MTTSATIRQVAWQEYDAIQSVVDGVDVVAVDCERKWGVGRLELLVSDELREKFRRQLRRFNDAINDNDVERVRQSGPAMRRAWEVLDKAAAEAGQQPIDPDVWEVALSDGRVVALCRNNTDGSAVSRAGRHVDVWTVDEIVHLIEAFPTIALAKSTFPGARVESARSKRVSRSKVFDDPIPF